MIQDVRSYLLSLQRSLCEHLTSLETSAQFNIEEWQYETCGGGRTAVLEGGDIIERAGANFSHILGNTLPSAATVLRPELVGSPFEALGVSTVIHPRNPYVPTAHMNVRFFSSHTQEGHPLWWFGGGFDLTPYYPFEEDCVHWHQMAAQACAPFGTDVYMRFKKNCDEYFYIKHRKEARGIGGLFFDDLNYWSFEKCFEFMQSIGNHFILAYMPIAQKRKDTVYGAREKKFQCYRRGRYVEFNLVHDRGTLFGLQSGGRTESILMSLPSEVHWHYCFEPEPGTAEARVYEFLKPRDWLSS